MSKQVYDQIAEGLTEIIGGREAAMYRCWKDCKAGKRRDQEGDSYVRCCDPRVCRDWRNYINQ